MTQLNHRFRLDKLNTLRLQSMATAYVQLTKADQLAEIGKLIGSYQSFFVLGGGSNLILPENYNGLVIHNQLSGITIDATSSTDKTISAMAGENWDSFVAWCCENNAHGLENLSLIPGTVGASPIQNIGAYGVEVKDFIKHVTVYDLTDKKLVQYENSDCKFNYRNSFFKNNSRYIVVSVTFQLPNNPQLNTSYGDIAKEMHNLENPTPLDLRNCIIKIRSNKLPNPAEIGNVGSFFHNPVIPESEAEALHKQYPQLPIYTTDKPGFRKVSAGWLIDNLGLKGYRQKNVGVYDKQALVLVNHEPATKTDILELANFIQQQILDKYNIRLNIEPIIL